MPVEWRLWIERRREGFSIWLGNVVYICMGIGA